MYIRESGAPCSVQILLRDFYRDAFRMGSDQRGQAIDQVLKRYRYKSAQYKRWVRYMHAYIQLYILDGSSVDKGTRRQSMYVLFYFLFFFLLLPVCSIPTLFLCLILTFHLAPINLYVPTYCTTYVHNMI